MAENPIQGFQTDTGVEQYDYNALANKPTLITQTEIDIAITTANRYTDEQIARIDTTPIIQIELDTSLSVQGKAADAKAVGDALGEKLDTIELDSAINTALAQAKVSGEFDGPQGPQGPRGEQGPQGEKGEPGVQGIQGPPGEKGEKGEPGEKGADGVVSFEALTQEQKDSLKGEQGPAGPQGEQGPAGPKGEQGPQGEQGIQGIQGIPGEKGEKGEKGEQGPQGIPGPAGPQGERGEKGDIGETGATGPQGIQGIQGIQGDKGDSATVEVGTVTTGDPGTNASVTNVGTGTDAIFNFVIPRGNTGAKGDKGDTGAPATLVSSSIAYQASSSGVIVPSGTWSSSVPTVAHGNYLWTRVVQTFNTGNPVTYYSVSRMGMDGSDSVSSVCSKSPDSNGNVQLTASDVGAAEKKKYGKLVVFGDSLGQGYNNGDYSFVDVLSESGVFESVSKHCVAGATIGPYQVDSSAAGYSLVEQIERYSSDVADAEILICEYGGNDLTSFLAGNVEMGTVEDASTATTICGYVKKAITRIYELNPDVAIHWLYPFPREFATLKAMFPNSMDYVDGSILFDACALRMAQNCGCFILIPFCQNRNLFSSDSVHPNTEGHKVYATAVLNGLFKEQHLLCTERLLTLSGDPVTLSNLTLDGTFASVLKLIKANVPVRLVSQYAGTTIFANLALFNQYGIGFTMLYSPTGSDAVMAYIAWKSDGSVEVHNISLVANAPNAEEVYV